MTIFSAALDRLVEIEETVAITSPAALTIQKAFKYPPAALQASDMPVVVNAPHFDAGELIWAPDGQKLNDTVSVMEAVTSGPVGGLEYPAESGQIWQRADIVISLQFREAKAFAAHTP